MIKKSTYCHVLGAILVAVITLAPIPALAMATVSTDLALSWEAWYDNNSNGSYDEGTDTIVDISNASLTTSWQYSSQYWAFPGSPVDTVDSAHNAVFDSTFDISQTSNGGTTNGESSIKGTSEGFAELHAESTVNGGLVGADWEQHSEWTSLFNFHFEPGNLIGTATPDTDFYITLLTDSLITSSKDCTGGFPCWAGGSIDLDYFQYGSWRDDDGNHFYSTGANPTSLISIDGADSADATQEFSILLAPIYEPAGGNLLTYTGINVSAGVRATAIYRGSDEEPPVNVPEPAIIALFGIGLAGMGFARKKRKSA